VPIDVGLSEISKEEDMPNPPLSWKLIVFLMVCGSLGSLLALLSAYSRVGRLHTMHFVAVAVAYILSCVILIAVGRRRRADQADHHDD
jgi:hypothetical protein